MKRWLLAAVMVTAAGCKDAPSEDQCKKLLDHLVDLELKKAGAGTGSEETKAQIAKQKEAVTTAKSEEFIGVCVDKMAKGRVECALAANDLDAVAKCDEQK